MKYREDYDEDNDILGIHWGGQTEHSIELLGGMVVLDVGKKGDYVGIEIFDFKKFTNESIKKMDTIMETASKSQEESK